jgi:POTRA domain, FtsQ-type
MPGKNNTRQATTAGYAVRKTVPRSRKKMWIKLSVWVVALGLVGSGFFYTLQADYFDVVRVESGAYRYTVQKDLDHLLEGYLGENIWTLSESQVAENLATLPWVKDLLVFKHLPGTIQVDFREWRPLLVLEPNNVDDPTRVMVEDGRILEFPDHLPLAALPVLVGVPCQIDTLSGQLRLDPEWAGDVLSLLDAMASTGLETDGPVDFLVARSEGFAIVLQEGRGQLLVGREDFSERLARYMAARGHLESGLQMDLRFRDKITCNRL